MHNSWESQGVGREMLMVVEVVPKCFLKKDQKTKRGQDKRDERLRHFRKRK